MLCTIGVTERPLGVKACFERGAMTCGLGWIRSVGKYGIFFDVCAKTDILER